jgi:hypothetical protein
MNAYTRVIKGRETPIGRAIKFTHDYCKADPALALGAAEELVTLLKVAKCAKEYMSFYGKARGQSKVNDELLAALEALK